MATVSNLVVKLSTDNKKLMSGLKQAQSRLKSLGSSMVGIFKTASKVIAASITAALAVAILQFKKVSEEIDKLAKTALLLNVGTNELQKLRFVAQKAGIDIRTVDLGLQRMTRRIGEASMGTGEALKAIQALGLDAKKLGDLPLDKQFETVAKAIAGVDNEAQQLAFTFKFFDSEAARILNIIRLGADKLGKEFDELNLGITDAEAKSVETMNDKFTDLRTIIKSIKQLTVVFIAPAITDGVNALTEYVKTAGGARAVTKGLILDALDFSKTALSGFYELSSVLDRISFTIEVIKNAFSNVTETVGRMGKGIKDAIKEHEGLNLGKTLGRIADSVINPNAGIEFDTQTQQRQLQFLNNIKNITDSQLERDREQHKILEFINKTRERTLKIETDITKAREKQKQGQFSDVTGSANSSRATTPAKNRVFRTKDEFGNTTFSRNAPQNAKSVVELRLIGTETKKLIKAEVREEVEQATRFDRN